MLLPAKREALRICKRSYPIMENLMAPRTPVLFFSGLIRFLDSMACHHALDETGGGSAKKTPPSAWTEQLAEAEYRILFAEGTEPPGSSLLNHETRQGTFICAACFLPLFESRTKYTSGTGWPSFWKPLAGGVGTSTDYKVGYPRTEVHCARCGGHQGHVLDDGPKPTGKRYCMNGLAMTFMPA